MSPAIKVQNLGKEYVIGSKEKGNETFREMLVSSLSAPFRRLTQSKGKSGQEERFWALKDISFEIQTGEVVGIIGRNGAVLEFGKKTWNIPTLLHGELAPPLDFNPEFPLGNPEYDVVQSTQACRYSRSRRQVQESVPGNPCST